MKKVLILYASYGGGHLSAAKSIQKYLSENMPHIETEIIDCIEYINKVLNRVTTGAYREMAKKVPILWGKVYSDSQSGILGHVSSRANKMMAIKLKNLIKEKNPDLVISTHPFGSQMVSYLRKKGKVECKLATILTDFSSHEQWLIGHEYTEYFFVSNESMRQELITFGVSEEKINVTGIPMSDKFFKEYNKEEIFDLFNLDKSKKVILFFGGGEFGLGKERPISVLKSLINHSENYQIVAVSGKNEKMKLAFEEVVHNLNAENKVRILGFTDKVPELMNISTLVVTKPGGLTTTESLACHLPLIIINPIPGQEEENAEFLEKHNVGIWIRKNDNPDEFIKEILSSEEKLKKMRENTYVLAKPTATKDICNVLVENL